MLSDASYGSEFLPTKHICANSDHITNQWEQIGVLNEPIMSNRLKTIKTNTISTPEPLIYPDTDQNYLGMHSAADTSNITEFSEPNTAIQRNDDFTFIRNDNRDELTTPVNFTALDTLMSIDEPYLFDTALDSKPSPSTTFSFQQSPTVIQPQSNSLDCLTSTVSDNRSMNQLEAIVPDTSLMPTTFSPSNSYQLLDFATPPSQQPAIQTTLVGIVQKSPGSQGSHFSGRQDVSPNAGSLNQQLWISPTNNTSFVTNSTTGNSINSSQNVVTFPLPIGQSTPPPPPPTINVCSDMSTMLVNNNTNTNSTVIDQTNQHLSEWISSGASNICLTPNQFINHHAIDSLGRVVTPCHHQRPPTDPVTASPTNYSSDSSSLPLMPVVTSTGGSVANGVTSSIFISTNAGQQCGGEKKCEVCGDRAVNHNFGRLTCESCKAFFRRNAHKKLVCTSKNGEHEITPTTRRECPACRLKRCFSVGMRSDLIQVRKKDGSKPRWLDKVPSAAIIHEQQLQPDLTSSSPWTGGGVPVDQKTSAPLTNTRRNRTGDTLEIIKEDLYSSDSGSCRSLDASSISLTGIDFTSSSVQPIGSSPKFKRLKPNLLPGQHTNNKIKPTEIIGDNPGMNRAVAMNKLPDNFRLNGQLHAPRMVDQFEVVKTCNSNLMDNNFTSNVTNRSNGTGAGRNPVSTTTTARLMQLPTIELCSTDLYQHAPQTRPNTSYQMMMMSTDADLPIVLDATSYPVGGGGPNLTCQLNATPPASAFHSTILAQQPQQQTQYHQQGRFEFKGSLVASGNSCTSTSQATSALQTGFHTFEDVIVLSTQPQVFCAPKMVQLTNSIVSNPPPQPPPPSNVIHQQVSNILPHSTPSISVSTIDLPQPAFNSIQYIANEQSPRGLTTPIYSESSVAGNSSLLAPVWTNNVLDKVMHFEPTGNGHHQLISQQPILIPKPIDNSVQRQSPLEKHSPLLAVATHPSGLSLDDRGVKNNSTLLRTGPAIPPSLNSFRDLNQHQGVPIASSNLIIQSPASVKSSSCHLEESPVKKPPSSYNRIVDNMEAESCPVSKEVNGQIHKAQTTLGEQEFILDWPDLNELRDHTDFEMDPSDELMITPLLEASFLPSCDTPSNLNDSIQAWRIAWSEGRFANPGEIDLKSLTGTESIDINSIETRTAFSNLCCDILLRRMALFALSVIPLTLQQGDPITSSTVDLESSDLLQLSDDVDWLDEVSRQLDPYEEVMQDDNDTGVLNEPSSDRLPALSWKEFMWLAKTRLVSCIPVMLANCTVAVDLNKTEGPVSPSSLTHNCHLTSRLDDCVSGEDVLVSFECHPGGCQCLNLTQLSRSLASATTTTSSNGSSGEKYPCLRHLADYVDQLKGFLACQPSLLGTFVALKLTEPVLSDNHRHGDFDDRLARLHDHFTDLFGQAADRLTGSPVNDGGAASLAQKEAESRRQKLPDFLTWSHPFDLEWIRFHLDTVQVIENYSNSFDHVDQKSSIRLSRGLLACHLMSDTELDLLTTDADDTLDSSLKMKSILFDALHEYNTRFPRITDASCNS